MLSEVFKSTRIYQNALLFYKKTKDKQILKNLPV